MFRPGTRIIHPELGDCTDDVVEALLEQARLDEPVILERRQAEIAAQSSRLARKLSCGRLVAEFDEDVYAAWESQRPGFFKKEADGLDYLMKHFPACRVDYKPAAGLQTAAGARNRYRVTGKRGRWAA